MRRFICMLCVIGSSLVGCGDNRTYVDKAAYTAPAAPQLSCVPNLDGQIDASELQAAIGVPVSYLTSPSGTQRHIDVAGQQTTAGKRVWELSVDYADDRVAKLQATSISGKWYATSFPTAQFVSPLDLGGRIEGVYANDGSALTLLGYASAEATPTEGVTLVVYATPIAVFRFPLISGKDWVSVSEVRNATVFGLPYAGRDTYHVTVDGTGQLDLPDVSFTQALRVRTTTTIERSIGLPITRKQVGWVFECFGEVARATSLDGELQDDFTTTSELRRLGF